MAAPVPGLATAIPVFSWSVLTITVPWLVSGVAAGTPASPTAPCGPDSERTALLVTGRFDVTVAKPLINRGPSPMKTGDRKNAVWPPASWNVLPTGWKFSSVKDQFNGVPSSFVNVIVPLAGGVPRPAGFVTA